MLATYHLPPRETTYPEPPTFGLGAYCPSNVAWDAGIAQLGANGSVVDTGDVVVVDRVVVVVLDAVVVVFDPVVVVVVCNTHVPPVNRKVRPAPSVHIWPSVGLAGGLPVRSLCVVVVVTPVSRVVVVPPPLCVVVPPPDCVVV